MKSIVNIIIFVWVFVASEVGAIEGHETVMLDVVVLEERKPVEGATLSCGFEQYYGSRPSVVDTVLTDTNGCAQALGESSGDVDFSITKDGYYKHHESMKLLKEINMGPVSTNLTIELNKIINPIPMYVKREKREIPKIDDFFGYDFEVGDWVAPHGEGKISDILFKAIFTSTDRSNYSVTLEVKFPGEYNGIQPMPREYQEWQGSQLRSSHQAPETGYVDYLNMSRFRKGGIFDDGDFSEKDREGYYFRIRSEVDIQGNLISAQYGKIYGSINLYGGISERELGLAFLYYFNPDKTRNVEFDPKRNLFLKQPEGGFLPQGRAKLKYSITAP
ncbi:MAG: hypothetical protein JXR23_08780 [Pontiellaceae bacterium]|nr:hypothetical protein [Pontiellaceae bacterium]